MNIIATYNETKAEYRLRRTGEFGVVNLDYLQRWGADYNYVTHKSRPSRNKAGVSILGLPATARFVENNDGGIVSLHRDLQLWMHELCKSRVPSMSDQQAKNSWYSLMEDGKFITDHAGSATHANFVNNTNLLKEPMKLKPMVTGGTILKIKGERRVKGVDCYVIEAVNPTGDYRQYTPQTHWWLFFYPTISRREQVVRPDHALIENLSIPFPQYNEQVILPVFAMAGMNENYVPKDRVTLVSGDFPSPYVGRDIANPYQGR